MGHAQSMGQRREEFEQLKGYAHVCFWQSFNINGTKIVFRTAFFSQYLHEP
uniref:Uncharacterized protein n=1 Tax=Arundo donax TaxID=35708 RepID=A0A0A9ERK1_ARUDO